MSRAHIPLISPSTTTPPAELVTQPPSPAYPPKLWNCPGWPQQRQFAQHWAELIRRIRRPDGNGKKEGADDLA